MKLVFLDDFFIIIDPLLQHMIVGSQMGVHQTNGATVHVEPYTNSTFITLSEEKKTILFVSPTYGMQPANSPIFPRALSACIPFQLAAGVANVSASQTPTATIPASVPSLLQHSPALSAAL